MSALGAPILAGLAPPRGALVAIAALAVLAVLDRIPLSAYRPHQDDGRTPRRRRRQVRVVGEHPPPTTVHRLDQPAITAPRSQAKDGGRRC